MTFEAILAEVLALLQREGRVSYHAWWTPRPSPATSIPKTCSGRRTTPPTPGWTN